MATADDLALRRFDDATRDAPRLQLETLRTILAENSGSAYLRRYLPEGGHVQSAADATAAAEEFRRLVPVSCYEDYADAIRRVVDGEAGPEELSPRPLLCFFLSSGTSSMRPKLVPYFDSPGAMAASAAVIQTNSALVRRLFPPRPTVNKALWFLYAGEVTKTKGGYDAIAATAWGIRRSASGTGTSPVLSACVSPAAVLLGADHQQQLYCHLLCGLRRRDAVDCIRAPYAAGLVRAVRLLESKWQQLCDDIESGTVCADAVADAAMRGAVQGVLAGPRPGLAGRVRGICRREEWRGVLRDLWPEMRYISCASTGTMEQYFPAIKHFAGATVPVLGTDYLASECPVGVNLERTLPPEETTYVLLPTAAYFEFIPFDFDTADEGRRSDGALETVDITGVEVGRAYEVVATTFRGLYRYRLGDVVKVAGFHNSSPRLQFVTRASRERDSEMFTERDVMVAMGKFQMMLNKEEQVKAGDEIVEFAAYIVDDVGTDRPQQHAKIAVEVSKGSGLLVLDEERSEECSAFLSSCCKSLEGCLGVAYGLRRARDDVGPLEIAIVRPGSFDKLAEVAMRGGAPASQYKPPKIVRHRSLIDVLESFLVCSSLKQHGQ